MNLKPKNKFKTVNSIIIPSRVTILQQELQFEDNTIPFLDILLKRCPGNTFSTSVHRTLQVGLFRHTSQVQNKPYPNTHVLMLPNLLFAIFTANRYCKDLRKLLLQNGHPQGVVIAKA